MKILVRQFLGKNHSWSVCGWGIARALIRAGHQVDLFSTDGIGHFPQDLKPNLIGYCEETEPTKITGRFPSEQYDCQISYTAMKNFSNYLSHGNRNRFGIWCYEWAGKNVLPNAFAKQHHHCDYVLAPSTFAKTIFTDSSIPDSKIKVIPHGIENEFFYNSDTITLPTKKKFKILANVAQNHLRKNIPGLLEAYGRAFTSQDDVCLILKARNKPIRAPFEVSLDRCLETFYSKYPDHAELKLFTEFLPDISSLYRSVDAVFTLTYGEGFFFPGLEALASGKMVIAPESGGQLDFLNNTNSLLIKGNWVRADPRSMYWESKPNAIWFEASIPDAVQKLREARDSFEQFNAVVRSQIKTIKNNYSWDSVVKQIVSLCR